MVAEISLATAALLHSTSVRLARVATPIVAVHRSRGEAGVFVGAAHRHAEECDENAIYGDAVHSLARRSGA